MGYLGRLGVVAAVSTLAAPAARAAAIDLQIAAGNNFLVERLSVDSRPNSRRESGLVGDGSFSLASAETDYPLFGHVVDRTYALGGSLGWKFNRSWEAGLMLNFSSAPSQSLQQSGGTLYGDFTHYFAGSRGSVPAPKHESRKPSAKEDFPPDFLADLDDPAFASLAPALFQPSLGFRLMLGRTHMTDRPNAVLRALFPSLANEVDEINQRFMTIEVAGQPWRWFGARLSVTTYSYDKDVNQFLLFLSDRRSLGATTFAASVNGLPKSSSALGLYFYPSDTWEIDWIGNTSRSISTGTIARGTQITVTHDFTSWLRIGFGLERDVSDDIAQTLALLNFSFGI